MQLKQMLLEEWQAPDRNTLIEELEARTEAAATGGIVINKDFPARGYLTQFLHTSFTAEPNSRAARLRATP